MSTYDKQPYTRNYNELQLIQYVFLDINMYRILRVKAGCSRELRFRYVTRSHRLHFIIHRHGNNKIDVSKPRRRFSLL